jgi:transcriptional regulator with PAS, ATPase and Fis domain
MARSRFGDDVLTTPVPPPRAGSVVQLRLSVICASTMRTYPLPAVGEVSIGRSPQSTVCIDDQSISRVHATLHMGPDLEIEDRGGLNGIRVSGRLIPPHQRRPIAIGETLELGTATIVVLASPVQSPVAPSGSLVVIDPAMIELHQMAEQVGAGKISVLLLGETGTGKEILAEAIHHHSPRRDKPLLRLNCAALAENLLESELFGHEKGSFSGAVQAKPGLLETAEGGTVFLDEVGDMPSSLQSKLLRVLEERRVTRVGGLKSRAIDVRLISATNHDLEAEAARGVFRPDLYYRLNGISLLIPPLRQRLVEIESLAELFVARIAGDMERSPPRLSAAARQQLRSYGWPGNIRELRNVIERAVLLSTGDEIPLKHLPSNPMKSDPLPAPGGAAPVEHMPLETLPAEQDTTGVILTPEASDERSRIVAALERCAGNQTQAARLLGVSRGTLVSRIIEYSIPRPRKR